MDNAVGRHVFYISDGTTITMEVLGHAVMSQFPATTGSITLSFVEDEDRAWAIKDQTDAICHQTGVRPLVFYSVVLLEIRTIILQDEGFCQDIVQVLAAPLQQEMRLDPTPIAHCTHGLSPNNLSKYDARITAIDYTLTHDDSILLYNLDQAQVILLSASHYGKTPTSPYLAIRLGTRAMNYPFTTGGMDSLVLPASLESFQYKSFSLATDPGRLMAIRGERRENSHHTSLRQCRMEAAGVEVLYRKSRTPQVNNTNYSVEEITTGTLDVMDFSRRIYQRTSTSACSFVIMLTTRRGVTHLVLEINCDWLIVMRITSRQSRHRGNKFLRLVMNRTDEFHAARIKSLATSAELMLQYPVMPDITTHITDPHHRIEKTLNGGDRQLLVTTGSYSIHDPTTTMEYATHLQSLCSQYQSRLEITVRTYFEKPRTVVGWRGLISNPGSNGNYRVSHGLELARRLLLQVNELSAPTTTEFLDMVTSQFVADLINWGAIGTRTTESQIHREMVSTLSYPMGSKNGTDGNTRIVVDTIRAAHASHMFLSSGKDGQTTIYQTSDNPYGHITICSGKKPNYRADGIAAACGTLYELDLSEHLVVDFNHGNCREQHHHQLEVCEDIYQQIRNGSTTTAGIMAESFLCEGA